MNHTKVNLPQLDLSPENVVTNRDIILSAKAAYKAALQALDGMAKANSAMCKHENKEAEYDPGYAGGGFSNYKCPDCGSTNVY